MKVRHTMLLVINCDYNSEKSTNFGHVNWANYTSLCSSNPHPTTEPLPTLPLMWLQPVRFFNLLH